MPPPTNMTTQGLCLPCPSPNFSLAFATQPAATAGSSGPTRPPHLAHGGMDLAFNDCQASKQYEECDHWQSFRARHLAPPSSTTHPTVSSPAANSLSNHSARGQCVQSREWRECRKHITKSQAHRICRDTFASRQKLEIRLSEHTI